MPPSPTAPNREFWLLVYRGIMMVAEAIKKYYIDAPPHNPIMAAPARVPPNKSDTEHSPSDQ